MKPKQYYCSPDSTIYSTNFRLSIAGFFISALCFVLLICPLLVFWIYDWLGLDIDTSVVYLILVFLFGYSLFTAITTTRIRRRLAKNPTLEIDEESITVANHNNGSAMVVKLKDIEKFEITQIKIFGKVIRCINVIPSNDAYSKIISRIRNKPNRVRAERLYKTNGAIEQIYEHLLDQSIDAVYEDIQDIFKEYQGLKQ